MKMPREFLAATILAALALASPFSGAGAHSHRLLDGADGRRRGQRQGGAPGAQDLGGGPERQGRPSGPAGEARLLRRPDRAGAGAGHLHEAARGGQGRAYPRALFDRHERAADADRDGAQHGAGQPHGLGRQRAVPLSANISRRCRPGRIRRVVFSRGFFNVAAAQNPKPQTVAMASSDQEFSRNASDGARENAKAHGIKVVYDKVLSADHDRFLAHRARGPGDQPRHLLHRLISAGLGRHDQVHQRDRLQAQDVRRLDGGLEQHHHQDAAWARS